MDIETYLRFLLVLVFVLGLIALFAWLARRFGVGGRVAATSGRNRRLGVVEVLPLDGRRKLVLLHRDDREHLVILGQSEETVVETGITDAGGSFADQLDREARP